MTRGKAEDAGGLTPAKDDNAAPYHFDRRTLSIFKCVDYKNLYSQPLNAVWPVFFPPYCIVFPCNARRQKGRSLGMLTVFKQALCPNCPSHKI
jgi:hypothetical protein